MAAHTPCRATILLNPAAVRGGARQLLDDVQEYEAVPAAG